MVDDRTSQRRRSTSGIAQAYRDSHEVMSIVLSIAVFAGGGFWLDSKYRWTPVLTICGLVVGCLLAAVSLKQFLLKLDRRSKQKREELEKAKPYSEAR
ncbi:MAG: AtpZ/AtpI family protein [Fuerstiella sp.]